VQALLQVLQWLHDEEAVDAPYLAAALAEYEASCEAHGVSPPQQLQVLCMEVAMQQGLGFQVCTRLQSRVEASAVDLISKPSVAHNFILLCHG
jgi:hypothetical protein